MSVLYNQGRNSDPCATPFICLQLEHISAMRTVNNPLRRLKKKMNLRNGELHFNHFVDKARVPNCVKGLRNTKKKNSNMLGIVKCKMNVFNDSKQLMRRNRVLSNDFE